ncbi:hypothetical protein L2E82_47506 [Cichorium intybus]|uniref:Uncharacterized protein n=1 Tax=Cichorium intybus TaxID=13427 RepID=A0ACB8YWR6_CICIN|nr:hypothetical protein L2E82_47506 [Cichorium intybus]
MVMNREDVAAYIQKQNQEIERFIGLQANNLGLHPRQVAIWFQNKRARSKSRQIEQENNTLKHNYETLATKSESLKKVNQALLNQLEMLINAAERNGENTSSECGLDIKTESLHKLRQLGKLTYDRSEDVIEELEKQTERCAKNRGPQDGEEPRNRIIPLRREFSEFFCSILKGQNLKKARRDDDGLHAKRKAAGISIISGSVCCEDQFGWHMMNFLNAGVEDGAYIFNCHKNQSQSQLTDFIF